MVRKNLRWVLLFATYVTFSAPAYAYLDPATGSILIQAVIGVVATWIMYSKMYAAKAKSLVSKLVTRRNPQDAESQ
jgi:hypothetical protein